MSNNIHNGKSNLNAKQTVQLASSNNEYIIYLKIGQTIPKNQHVTFITKKRPSMVINFERK